ncbi:MAG: glutamate--tRNA ligase [Candidatus Paceibacterota bacterium]
MKNRSVKTKKVRIRFAPSPTGFFHIGGARTALFNYLFAKKNKGDFILRIEDTDIERSKPEFEKDIMESLKWLGIDWTEGPDIGGDFRPYRQSERSGIYRKYLEKLLKENKAYYCFCSPDELDAKRQDQMSRGLAPKYDGKCSSLTADQVNDNLKKNVKSVIRLRSHGQKVSFTDIIRGEVEFDTSLTGDFVIARNLDNPLFYLSGAIDDHEMEISHIIRGEEHISNTPKQILIQEALGLDKPIYGHIPLILAPDRSKLSKRFGAVSVIAYKKEGYLRETLVNFLAFLGWNPGDEREIFSLDLLAEEFSLEKVQKGGAIFNQKRLDFLNGYYIRQKPLKELTELLLPYLITNKLIEPFEKNYRVLQTGEEISFKDLEKICYLYQTRIKKLSEIVECVDFLFQDKLLYASELLRWGDMSPRDIFDTLAGLEKLISGIKKENWDFKNLQNVILLETEKMPNRGLMLWPLRVALTGKKNSADPIGVAEILGKDKVLKRLAAAKEILNIKE